jgi:hypothetical protein
MNALQSKCIIDVTQLATHLRREEQYNMQKRAMPEMEVDKLFLHLLQLTVVTEPHMTIQ